MYVELYGPTTRNQLNFPAVVYLRLRHMSAAYFRDANGSTKEFRQPLGTSRTFQFNRFAITTRCNEEKLQGNNQVKGALKLAAALYGPGFETRVENSETLTLLFMEYLSTAMKLRSFLNGPQLSFQIQNMEL